MQAGHTLEGSGGRCQPLVLERPWPWEAIGATMALGSHGWGLRLNGYNWRGQAPQAARAGTRALGWIAGHTKTYTIAKGNNSIGVWVGGCGGGGRARKA